MTGQDHLYKTEHHVDDLHRYLNVKSKSTVLNVGKNNYYSV